MAYDPRAYQARIRRERMAEARLKGRHTREEWLELKRFYKFRCVKCGVREYSIRNGWPITLEKDHVHEISLGGCDCIGNIQPLCQGCNTSKNGRKGKSWDFRHRAKRRWKLNG